MYHFYLYGYVIMSNHYHLLLQTPTPYLSKFMHQLNSKFAQYYNWLISRSGHVFQDRYKAFLVLDEKYLLTVLRYIHQNPVRAQICRYVSEYRWSSDLEYRGRKPGCVDKAFVLNMLSEDPATAVNAYRGLMDEHVDEAEKAALYQGLKQEQLADPAALQRECAASMEKAPVQEPPHTAEVKADLDGLLRQFCSDEREFALIKDGSRIRALRQAKISYALSAKKAGYTMQEIGANISQSAAAVLKLIRCQAP